jgi:hypothetical protein
MPSSSNTRSAWSPAPPLLEKNFSDIEVAIHVDSAAVAVAQEPYKDCEDFRYRLIPVMDMDDVAFMQQNEVSGTRSPTHFTVHVYPFNTLPVLVSHIHPKFVIMATADAVSSQKDDT